MKKFKVTDQVRLLTGKHKDFVGSICGISKSNKESAPIIPLYNKTKTRIAVYCDYKTLWMKPENLVLW